MEDWQKHLWKIVSTAGQEIEHFFRDVNDALMAASEELNEVVEETLEDFQSLFYEEKERDRETREPSEGDNEARTDNRDRFDLNFESYFLGDETDSDLGFYDIYYLEASAKHQPACVGCRHYHGRVYNGNLLVCAMYPEGQPDDRCPDWEE
jgi:hypothetical protein